METKIDIAAILKDKPKNTKLYSPIFGDVYFLGVEDNIIKVTHRGKLVIFFGDGRYYNYPESEPLLFPSKEMHDWEKFSWKKGDILINPTKRINVTFVKFIDDSYTTFEGAFYLEDISSNGCSVYTYELKPEHLRTKDYIPQNKEEAKHYLQTIPVRLINDSDTLNIEKQPEFKDGDIVFMKGIKSKLFANCIFILKGEYKDGDERAFYYAFYNADNKFTEAEYGNTKVHYSLRLATDSEKQQLFDALAKKNKTWDIEKKMIVDVKPKWTPKPFDKVLVRDSKSSEWRANLFSHKNIDEPYCCVYAGWNYCIPYEGNEHLLGTTKNVRE